MNIRFLLPLSFSLLGVAVVLVFQFFSTEVLASHTVGVIPPFDRSISPTSTVVPFYADNAPFSTFPKPGIIPYALPEANIHNDGAPLLLDWNGDGLQDLILSDFQRVSHSYDLTQYVLLNDGVNLTAVYKCQIKKDSNTNQQKRYWGDCADYSREH